MLSNVAEVEDSSEAWSVLCGWHLMIEVFGGLYRRVHCITLYHLFLIRCDLVYEFLASERTMDV